MISKCVGVFSGAVLSCAVSAQTTQPTPQKDFRDLSAPNIPELRAIDPNRPVFNNPYFFKEEKPPFIDPLSFIAGAIACLVVVTVTRRQLESENSDLENRKKLFSEIQDFVGKYFIPYPFDDGRDEPRFIHKIESQGNLIKVTYDLREHPYRLDLGGSKFQKLKDGSILVVTEVGDRLHFSSDYDSNLDELIRA